MQIFDDDKEFSKEINYIADNNLEIDVAGKKMTLGEYRKIEKKYGDSFKEDSRDVLIFWEDVMQFTTIGLLDLLYEKYLVIPDANLEDYFFRSNELLDPIDYTVYDLNKHGIKITKEEVGLFLKENYVEVIKHSPMSSVFPAIIKSSMLYKSVTFCFKYAFEGMTEFLKSIREDFEKGMTMSFIVLEKFDDSIEKMLDKYGSSYDYFITLDMASILEYIVKNKVKNLAIMGPQIHNGISKGAQELFEIVAKEPFRGPYNSELIYYHEGVVSIV